MIRGKYRKTILLHWWFGVGFVALYALAVIIMMQNNQKLHPGIVMSALLVQLAFGFCCGRQAVFDYVPKFRKFALRKERACDKCGYPVRAAKGTKTAQCPECGHIGAPQVRVTSRRRRVAKWASLTLAKVTSIIGVLNIALACAFVAFGLILAGAGKSLTTSSWVPFAWVLVVSTLVSFPVGVLLTVTLRGQVRVLPDLRYRRQQIRLKTKKQPRNRPQLRVA